MNNSLEKRHLNQDEVLLIYIKNNPGLSFRQIRFRLEMNESVLNNNLKTLIKHNLIRKSNDLRYFSVA